MIVFGFWFSHCIYQNWESWLDSTERPHFIYLNCIALNPKRKIHFCSSSYASVCVWLSLTTHIFIYIFYWCFFVFVCIVETFALNWDVQYKCNFFFPWKVENWIVVYSHLICKTSIKRKKSNNCKWMNEKIKNRTTIKSLFLLRTHT